MAKSKHGKKKNNQNTKFQQQNNATAPDAELTKPVNCHYVPQWILRRFSKEECSKDNWQKKDEKEIYYYCVESGTLTKRRIKEAYAEGDLYKDPHNPQDIGQDIEIERELSKIEYSASITAKFIHRAIEDRDMMSNRGEGSTTGPAHLYIKRKHLELLRKFLFIMYFHQPSLSKSYFDLDHPSNSISRRWIKAYQTRYGLLEGPKHIWLHVLRYYLITPHDEIHEAGRRVDEEMYSNTPTTGTTPEDDMEWEERYSTTEIDPELDDWKCFAYYLRMQTFLGIWEAAQGEEFVMSSNSFGVFEGGTISSGLLHRFFVVSPRIALVLYHPGLKEQENANSVVDYTDHWELASEDSRSSLLGTAPHKGGNVQYVSDQPPPSHSLFFGNPEVFAPSPADDFKFEICPLSRKDTHTVNGIILANILDNGAVTFGSRDAALRTLTDFNLNPEFIPADKQKVQSLVRQLSPRGSVQTVRERYFASRTPSECYDWATNLKIYRLLQQGTDADSIRFREWEELYRPLWPVDETQHAPLRPAQLVSTMDDSLAWDTFTAISTLLASLGPDLREEPIFEEQLIISLLRYLVNRNRFLLELIEDDVFGPREERGEHSIIEYIDEPYGTESAVASPEPKAEEHLSECRTEPKDISQPAAVNPEKAKPTIAGHSTGNPETIKQHPTTEDQIPILDISLTMLLEKQLDSICFLIFFVLRHCLFLLFEIPILALRFAWARGGARYWSMFGDSFPLLDSNFTLRDINRGYYPWVWLLIGSWLYVSVVFYIQFSILEWLGPADVFILFLFALQ